MSARIASKLTIAFLVVVATFSSAATILDAKHQPPGSDRLIVHEWGTFTSVSDASGKAQYWSPLSGPSDLPDFVYRSKEATSSPQGRCLKCELALVRMETPVLYFYADRETTASVKVDFPQGRITEWYPQARETGRGINWGKFTVLPGARWDFPVSKGESHYYPARETDAAPISLGDESQIEHEKFLFYRGVGNFDLPLVVKLAGDQVTVRNSGQNEHRQDVRGAVAARDQVTVRNSGQNELAQVVLFENRGGRVGWQVVNSLKGETTLARPALDQKIESLNCDLEKILVAQGLYEKEAAAMVKTWRNSWFEEGLRVFYIVPRKMTDTILPLTLTPAPTELVRVLVGRTEVITPEMEQAIQSSARKYLEGTAESRAAALKAIQPYGRFAEPVIRQMMNAPNDYARRIQEFMIAATVNSSASGR